MLEGGVDIEHSHECFDSVSSPFMFFFLHTID